uniref:DNA-directed DNA polymerase n=1 Tax=Glossina morsitans morsitans TaxID=37546 RepID=A0A1B0FM91_GLOMM
MPSSLQELSEYLSDTDLIVVKSIYNSDNDLNLMKRKGVFPYDYLDSIDRLQETQLPPRSCYSNKLINEECSVDDYEHARKVWNTFQCRTLGDYLLLYLKVDVLLLCDVFENFRKVCKNIYKLDPSQYYTTPGLSWDAMLKTTEIELELFTDIEQYNFIARGIRGGIIQCSKRYSLANNKYVSDYDPTQESNYLIYLDVNNLYGYTMSQCLPYKNFKWMTNLENFNLHEVKDGSQIGYILEVDLEYPSSLHDYHNDLPTHLFMILKQMTCTMTSEMISTIILIRPHILNKIFSISHY